MTIKKWDEAFKNFGVDELSCSCCGGYKFHPGFATAFQKLRDLYAKPILVSSCCRCEKYNATLSNSSKKSLHVFDNPMRGALGTMAADVRISDAQDRHSFLQIALMLKFSCYFIGGNPNAIHLDQRSLIGEPVIFW